MTFSFLSVLIQDRNVADVMQPEKTRGFYRVDLSPVEISLAGIINDPIPVMLTGF
ncbi:MULTISPECIES: hypothetical protein [unclassified Burkholderia]|uniref:hypothetical protein n=1 Tax=unclassified Burkholderia TaxID=2613784 RepID=UPI0015C5D3E8|nr:MULTISPECIES: hypothetical protein [unclassified Burkholderia]MDN7429572.1 hypothetical protein [Burkholderia sp. AU45388]